MEREQVGLYQWGSDNEFGLQDVSAYAVEVEERTPEEEYMNNEAKESLVAYIGRFDKGLIVILECLILRETRKRMEAITGWSSSQVSIAVKKVRELTLEWSERY